MSEFKMSEMEDGLTELRPIDETEPRSATAFTANAPLDDDYRPKRRGAWLGGVFLFILIAALAVFGWYGYNELKSALELNNALGTGEVSKLEKRIEAKLAENNFKLDKEMQALAQKQAELATQLAQTLKKADGSVLELAKSAKNFATLQKELNDLGLAHNATVKNLGDHGKKLEVLDKLSQDIATAQGRVNDLEATLTSVSNSLQALTQTSAEMSAQITALAKQQTAFSKSLLEMGQTGGAAASLPASTELQRLQSDIDKANLEILKLKNLNDAGFARELNALRNELGDLKRKVDLLR